MLIEQATIVSNTRLTGNLWQLVLCNSRIAQATQPGQFIHLLLNGYGEHLLRRPFSIHNVYASEAGNFEYLSVIYQVVGQGSELLTSFSAGAILDVLGPIGRGWQPPSNAKRVLVVGGGVGYAALNLLVAGLRAQGIKTTVLLGASNKAVAIGLLANGGGNGDSGWGGGGDYGSSGDDYGSASGSGSSGDDCGSANGSTRTSTAGNAGNDHDDNGSEQIATDDGSYGHHGLVTALSERALAEHQFDYLATCGPEPMMRIVAAQAALAGVLCEVSLERRMACGVGACLSCVVQTLDAQKRACVDGPIFSASEVVW